MAVLCERFGMRPCDVWELTLEERDALVRRMNTSEIVDAR